MLISIVGAVFAVLGIVAAVVLVGAPLGWLDAAPGASMWVLFPLFTLVGYGLMAVGSRDPAARVPTKVIAILLLLVALAAAVALMGSGTGVMPVIGGHTTTPLWYVLVLGGIVGAAGTAVFSRGHGAS